MLITNKKGYYTMAIYVKESSNTDEISANYDSEISSIQNSINQLGNIRINARSGNEDVRINGYTNLQLYIICVNVGGKNFQVLHVGDTSKTIAHYIIYGNGNLTYFWFDVQSNGTVRFVQSWRTNGGWISDPAYEFEVYQVMDIKSK